MKDQRALYIITTTMTPIAKPMTLSFYFFSGRGVRRQRAPTPLQAVWMEARWPATRQTERKSAWRRGRWNQAFRCEGPHCFLDVHRM